MNSEKLLVLFAEVSELKDSLNKAIGSANQIADLNSDSKNVTNLINRFNDLENLVDKKIEDVNDVTKAFRKRSVIMISATFLASMLVGVGFGLYAGKTAFTVYFQEKVLQDEIKQIAKRKVDLDYQKEKIKYIQEAKHNKVKFYKNGIIFPNNNQLQKTEDDQVFYEYPNK